MTVGHVTHDRYAEDIVPGGCAFYGAKTMHALGANVHLVTAVGADFACETALDGIKVTRTVGEQTTVFLNTYPVGGPRIQWAEATAANVAPSLIASSDRQDLDVLFIAPVFGELDLRQWLDTVDAKIVGVGLQGFLKQPGRSHSDVSRRFAVVSKSFDATHELLKRIDVVFLSDEDIRVFGTEDLLDKLLAAVPVVVLTRGEKGTKVFVHGQIINVGVFKTNVVDPTGAGDTFSAAFLFALARGESLEIAAKLGTAAASIIIENYGGANLSKVDAAFDRMPLIHARIV